MGVFFMDQESLFLHLVRKAVLQEIHEAHPGICRMKSLARGYVWWPKLDLDLEAEVKKINVTPASQFDTHKQKKDVQPHLAYE